MLNYFPKPPFKKISYLEAQTSYLELEAKAKKPTNLNPLIFIWPRRHFYRNPRALLNTV